MEALDVLTHFPTVTTEAWEARINQDLKGADYERKSPVYKGLA